MKSLLQTADREVWFGRVDHPSDFASPFGDDDFAILLVTGRGISPGERAALCDRIVRLPCRYAVCAGADCERWHDVLDESFLATDPNFDPPDERFIMTSWHSDEPLREAARFFLNGTSFDSFVARRFLAISVGADAAAEREVVETLTASAASG